jgi:hypothetical protein
MPKTSIGTDAKHVLCHSGATISAHEGAAALAPALQAMPGLTWLDLGLVHFLHAKASSATDAKSRLCHLRDNDLGPEGAAALAPALQAMPGLTSLDLGLVYIFCMRKQHRH